MVVLNDKQKELMHQISSNKYTYYLCYGGARSSKTFGILRSIVIRALKYSNTKHLIVRNKKTTCINTVWQDLREMLNKELGADNYTENKTDHIFTLPNGSTIWSGGLDDSTQVDKILGTQWATIYMNEASESEYQYFEKLKTRLNVNPKETKIKRKFFIDENPPSPAHWTYRVFFEGIDPNTNEKLPDEEYKKFTKMFFHPTDNKANLTEDYLQDLQRLTGMARKRFWEGVFAYNFVGQVYYNYNRDINVSESAVYTPNIGTCWRSWDFGIRDSMAIIWYQIVPAPKSDKFPLGVIINIFDELKDNERSADYYGKYVNELYKESNFYDACDPSGVARSASLESWVSLLARHGIRMQYKTEYSIADMVSNMNALLPSIRINPKCIKVIEALENWQYEMKDGKVAENAKPIHNDFSHMGTSLYYFGINAFPPNKKQFEMKFI